MRRMKICLRRIAVLLICACVCKVCYNKYKDDMSSHGGLKPLPVQSRLHRAGAVYTVVTAYCPGECCCGQYADGVTASGYVIQPGDKICAAPKNIPFGTIINIPGYGRAVVKDRGGAINCNEIDVYFDEHQTALQWGRQELLCN